MNQIIKACTIYNASLPSDVSLDACLSGVGFPELLSTQQLSIGFVPRVEHGEFTEKFVGGVSFTVRVDQKLVSSALLKGQTAERIKFTEEQTGRKPGKKERKEIRHEVLEDLLSTTPGQTTNVITCFMHSESGMLIIPSTSKKLCDRIVSTLVYAVGSLKTTTINVSNVKQGLTARLREWLDGGEDAFAGLDPVNHVVLGLDTSSVSVRMSGLDSASQGLKEALSCGFTVKSLGFKTSSGMEVRLSDDFKLSALVFAFPPDTGEFDDEYDQFAAEATLEVDEVVSFITFLCEMFGYQEPEAEGDAK